MNLLQNFKDRINTGESIDTTDIIRQMKDCDVVSFDIFDTLLKRNVRTPKDVFRYIEKKHKKPGYCEKRIKAEEIARAKKRGDEITLREIYNEMTYSFYDEELEAESTLLVSNTWILPVYKKAMETKTVIITSDMYMPEIFITKILEREGFGGYQKMYLSSSYGKTKKTGELYDIIKNDFGNKRILHIGDSFVSDYIVPKKKNIKAIHIPTNIKKDTYKIKENSVESNIINSFINNTSPIDRSIYYRFGYERFGMLLWGYSKWLHESIKKANINHIYFFSRDGLIMKKAFDVLYSDIHTHYLEVSRRSLRVPLLWMNHKLEYVINMISPSKQISLITLFDGVGLDITNYYELIKQYGFNIHTTFERNKILQNKKLIELYSKLSDDIEKNSKQEFDLLVKYIKQNQLTGKFAVVDIGWSGGMQRYLTEALKRLEIKVEIKGYYLGVAAYYKRNTEEVPTLDLNGYLFDYMHDKNAKDKRSAFVGLFESLFLEQDGSVQNYRYVNEKVVSNRLPYEYYCDGKPTIEYEFVMDIQEGALDFISKLGNLDIVLPADVLCEGVYESGLNPKKQDIDMFADFRFYDEGEITYLAKPKSLLFYLLHLTELKKDFLASRWKIGFMKRLFLINLPYYQIYRAMLKFK